MKSAVKIIQTIKAVCKFLDYQQDHQLIQDAELVCQQLVDPCFRIAVLAPFNFGKSTLINSILGREIMPTKVIRTTGTAIRIKYGKTPIIVITLKSGEVIKSSDPEILKNFAVLDKKGQQRNDVLSVEVFSPHPLLKNDVELLDLPGTNDRKEQTALIHDQLLQVDLVIQILNAKQPFTLSEQETLHQSLFERGIKKVVFVLNWMNELETEQDRLAVYNEAQSFTNDFKSHLPRGLQNLYRVDALPALKVKQKSSIFNISRQHGLIDFEVALHTIFSLEKSIKYNNRLPRVIAIAHKIKQALEIKKQPIEIQIIKAEEDRNAEITIGKSREALFQEAFKKSTAIFRNWLSLPTLIACYQHSIADALENDQFYTWKSENLELKIDSYQKNIEKCIQDICNEFYKIQAKRLYISFPSQPNVSLPTCQERKFGQKFGDIFNGGKNQQNLDVEYKNQKEQAYKDAANNYLVDFSKNALESIHQYEVEILQLIKYTTPPESPEIIKQR